MSTNKLILTCIILLISGCAVRGTSPYPTYSEGVHIYVSDQVIPSSQQAGDAYHIEGGQVYVRSDGNKNWEGIIFFIGFAIDQNRNEAFVSDVVSNLSVNFQETTIDGLQLHINSARVSGVRIAQEKSVANIVMFPSVTIHAMGQNKAKIIYNIETRYGGMYRKWYSYEVPGIYEIAGSQSLTEDHSKLLKMMSKVAFERIATAAIDDITHVLPSSSTLEEKTLIVRANDPNRIPYMFLKQYDGFIVTSAVRDINFLGDSKDVIDNSEEIENF
jgi:hypothetical protein